MNDRELVDWLKDAAEKQYKDGWFVFASKLDLAAARLDRLRWRGVEEGLPTMGAAIMALSWCGIVSSGHLRADTTWFLDGWVYPASEVTHWRYATPPGAEGGGE